MASIRNFRYKNSRRFSTDDYGKEVFPGYRERPVETAAPVVEHVVISGERLDLLALHYYNDCRLWWRIIDANPDIVFAGDLLLDDWAGEVILIPRASEGRSGA